MNRFITILGFSLAVAAFVYIFTSNTRYIILSLLVAIVISSLLFYLESVFRRQKSFIVSFISYFFQRSKRGCIIEVQECYYERLDALNWAYTKSYVLRSKKNSLDKFNDRFCWSSDSSQSSIEPLELGQQISSIQNEQIWTVFTIKFPTLLRGTHGRTGAKITNLVDADMIARPFLSMTARPKTKLLKMTVKIPKEFKPVNPRFEIYSSSGMDSFIASKQLSYDYVTQEICAPDIKYPRYNWRYVIVWDYGS